MYAQLMLYVYVCVPANSYVSTHVLGGACDVPITRMYVWADGCIRLYTGTRGPGELRDWTATFFVLGFGLGEDQTSCRAYRTLNRKS